MRLFIAVPLPSDTQRALVRAQRRVIACGATGRFVPEGNFHITLYFAGESDRLDELTRAMRACARDARPFSLRLGPAGYFSAGNGRTLYAGLTGDTDELARLHETLLSALLEQGFARGQGRFTPHITLGRSVRMDCDAPAPEAVPVAVDSIVLFESRSENGRMVYTPLHRETFS